MADTTWTRARGPVRVLGDLRVRRGVTLTIEAGTTVQFARNDTCTKGFRADWADSQFVGLRVEGTLRVLGTAQQPVRFLPAAAGAQVAWDGIRLATRQGEDGFEIRWAEFRGAHRALLISASEGLVRNSVLHECNVGIALEGGSAPRLHNLVFRRNRSAGILSDRSSPRVRGSLFLDGDTYGIWFKGPALAQIDHCAFWGNREGDVHGGVGPLAVWLGGPGGVLRDALGNLRADPVLRGSPADTATAAELKASQSPATETGPTGTQQLPGGGPFALSARSPLVDAGPDDRDLRDRDGTRNDIGLFGGPAP